MSNDTLKSACVKIDEMTKKVDELSTSNIRLEIEIKELRAMMDILLNMDKQIVSESNMETKVKKPNRLTLYKRLFTSDTYSSKYMNDSLTDADVDETYMGVIWKTEWIDEFSKKSDVLSKKTEEDKKMKIADYMWKTYINPEMKKKGGDIYDKIIELVKE